MANTIFEWGTKGSWEEKKIANPEYEDDDGFDTFGDEESPTTVIHEIFSQDPEDEISEAFSQFDNVFADISTKISRVSRGCSPSIVKMFLWYYSKRSRTTSENEIYGKYP